MFTGIRKIGFLLLPMILLSSLFIPVQTVSANGTSSVVVPNIWATTEAPSNNGFPFSASPARYQQVYSASEMGSGGTIDKIAFRLDEMVGGSGFTNVPVDLEVRLSHVSYGPDDPGFTTIFSNNIGPDETLVLDNVVYLSGTTSTTKPNPFDIILDVENVFAYNGIDNLLLDITIYSTQPDNGYSIYTFDATGNTVGDSVSRLTGVPASATSGSRSSYGLITQFTFISASPPDDGGIPCVEGYVINDDTGEGIEGWLVYLYNPIGILMAITKTNVDGKYKYCTTGSYTVCAESKVGWTNVSPRCIDVILTDSDITGINFRITTNCIEGYKINDATGEGIGGWSISLYNSSGILMAQTTTDVDGWYKFCGFGPGDYQVCEEIKAGWTNVSPTCINVTIADSDLTGINFRNVFGSEDGESLAGSTSVDVTSDGTPPVVKCKWEQQPLDLEPLMEDGDPLHLTPGFQILPPLHTSTTKVICYFAVVTDEEDMGNVSQVFADVYHPIYSPEPYGPNVTGGIQNLPYFKYEIPFCYFDTGDYAEAIVQQAYDAGLITFNSDYDIDDVLYELDKGTASLWFGYAEIDYEQPAGRYDVYVYGIDTDDGFSEPLWNQFEYMPVCGIEVDFTAIDFGSANLGVEKMIPGDTKWDILPPGINHATVRNVGNVWAHVKVMFDDMGLGQDVYDNWNVQYDARMGSNNAYYVGNIMPYEWVTLPNALGLSMKDELDFSIKVIKGTGEYNGVITLDCEMNYPFVDPVPEYVVGIDASTDRHNFVQNGGFEQGMTHWSISSGTATYIIDSLIRHNGNQSVKGMETNIGSLGRLYQNISGLATPGKIYMIGGWIKTQSVTGYVVIAVDYVTGAGWTPADGYVCEVGYVSGPQDWTYFLGFFTLPPMPADCEELWFLIDFNAGGGTAWIDDVFLYEIN